MEQLSISFECTSDISTKEVHTDRETEHTLQANMSNIISFPTALTGKEKNIRQNCKTGGTQEVFPIRKYEDILAMANWLYENKDIKYALAFIIGCNIGLRANELVKLKYNQVFYSDGSVKHTEDLTDISDVIYAFQGKTDKNRPIFLNKACVDALEWFFPEKEYRLPSDRYLFPSREGGHIEVGTFRKVLKEAAKACGIKENIGTHTLRKTFGYHLRMQNPETSTDVTLIQAMFGHSDPRITMRYIGMDIYEFKKAYHKLNINVVADQAFVRRKSKLSAKT